MANRIIVNLDTSKSQYNIFECKQNDDLILEANIFENGIEKDVTTKAITINCTRADGTYVVQNTDITRDKNKIIANLKRDFTRVAGLDKLEIVLLENEKQNTTFDFNILVKPSVLKSAVEESKDTVIILEELGNKIVEAGQVKVETENLIATGNAATKLDIANVNSQLEQNTTKVNEAIAKADNPIGAITSKGQKIPYSLFDNEAIKAITGSANIVTNAGYEKNRGVDYPLRQIVRDGVLSTTNDKIKNGILNIKVNGAKLGKYYRVEWLGNGVDLAGGTRLDILISEYDKSTYNSNSSLNKRDLIILNDGLGLNKLGDKTGIITRRYESPRDNISIEVTYDGDVLGTYLTLNQSTSAGYSFIIDESCYNYQNQLYPIICQKIGDEIQICFKYNLEEDLKIKFQRFGSNNLLQMGDIQIIPSTNTSVNQNLNISAKTTLVAKITDSISPYMLKSVNNADGDKISTSEYEFVGGCHGYNNGANDSISTARMLSYKVKADGCDIKSDGLYGCNKVDIIVTNRVQGNNTKKADGTGREILEENIIYTITQGKISVKNEIKALEDIKIYRNYGLQLYVQYFKANGKVFFVDGVDMLEKSLDSNAHAGTKVENSNCRKIILYSGTNKIAMSLNNEGLAYKRYINDSDKTAFWSNDKLYFQLINSYVTIPTNGKVYYSGSWEFESL